MGVYWWVIARKQKRAFELNKGWSDLADLFAGEQPTREAFDVAVHTAWIGPMEYSANEIGEDLDAYVFDSERDVYLFRTFFWPEAEERPAALREDGLPSDAFVLESAREMRIYTAEIADRLWRFCEEYGPWGNLSLLNDSGDDLPWSYPANERDWWCVGSSFWADQRQKALP